MAIRVRKLAKRLGRTPAELLGILHAIGIERYRSPEDMLSGPIEQKLVRAVKDGVQPERVELQGVRKAAQSSVEDIGDGWMPGVKRTVDPRFERVQSEHPVERRARPQRREPIDEPEVYVPRSMPDLLPAPAAVPPRSHEVQALLTAERSALNAAREVVAAERAVLAAERDALLAERARWEATREVPAVPTLLDVLSQRGLLGNDEAERAIRALVDSRRMGEVLPFLQVSDPDGLLRYLHEVLLLVDGRPPEGMAGAMVAVATDRSEVPGSAEWRRLTGKVSESLLLLGARRVLLVGGPSRMHRLLANALDPRIEVRFRPAKRLLGMDARADCEQHDVVVLWQVETDSSCRDILAEGKARVTTVQKPSVRTLLDTWLRDLASD